MSILVVRLISLSRVQPGSKYPTLIDKLNGNHQRRIDNLTMCPKASSMFVRTYTTDIPSDTDTVSCVGEINGGSSIVGTGYSSFLRWNLLTSMTSWISSPDLNPTRVPSRCTDTEGRIRSHLCIVTVCTDTGSDQNLRVYRHGDCTDTKTVGW